MGRNNYFQFKQFRIEQQQSAMKVGVDGVLLGAWAGVSGAERILDVGAGTGLIALMLAQRSPALVTAIEIEKQAAGEAMSNFASSPWKDRLEVHHLSFQEFALTVSTKFDLIVSNPPFFEKASKAASNERTLARHTDSLSYEELIIHSAGLLSENGSLAVIVPDEKSDELIRMAKHNQLHVSRITKVRPKPGRPINRVLLQWTKQKQEPDIQELCVYESDGVFTPGYIELTRDFYLKF